MYFLSSFGIQVVLISVDLFGSILTRLLLCALV